MTGVEGLLRELAPQVLGAVVRRYGHFSTAEDAVQEALLAAATQWPSDGLPDRPLAWLITVASRRLTDLLRSEQARLRREDTVARYPLPAPVDDFDDTLVLLFMCCHPTLSPASQIALTLRAVGGLTTTEIARAFLVPESTMTRRITRAKQSIKDSRIPFGMPADRDLGAVLHVLYLIFNEGYASTSGPLLQRADLAGEAIRMTRIVHRVVPSDGEVAGLLALMLLTDARRPARSGPDGSLIPMDEQDRSLWNQELIAEGVALISAALPVGPTGPYQVQAAIAAVHDEAPSAADTDWPQIVALYEVLLRIQDTPLVRLNHAVAVAMTNGPAAGMLLLEPLEKPLAKDHRLHSVKAHLLEMSGDKAAARSSYEQAARLTLSPPQQRYLLARACALGGPPAGG
ncbi:DUF6596 domain-containing protein [Actinocrispum sp. NPDC049592]|uniref:RNA polymerase sigma factor n=1 Tax=Actinocrispum sp. NPDC049592 TaxID=3154835 RepID=UPI003434BFC2